ncbi:MAG: hypothetical protein AB7U52_01535 [Candidatus Izemoplasmatales bacterium]
MQVFGINLALVDWLNANFWWPVILFVIGIFVIVRIVTIKPKGKEEVEGIDHFEKVVENLGGIVNIVTASLDGSRVKFQIKDIEVTKLDAFKEIGATGVFISGNNVKMVLPFNAQTLVDKINSDKSGGKL